MNLTDTEKHAISEKLNRAIEAGKPDLDFIQPIDPDPGQYTDTARLKVSLDIEINLVVNGKKVEVK